MARYILVYETDDYPENGGGTHVDFFESENQMHKTINNFAKDDPSFSIVAAGFLQFEFEYTPIEIVKEYKPKRKK